MSFIVSPFGRINQDGAKSLSNGLKGLSSLKGLSISIGVGNNIGCEGAQDISDALKCLVNLQSLNLNFSLTKLM